MFSKRPLFFVALSFLQGILAVQFKVFSLLLLVPALFFLLKKIPKHILIGNFIFFLFGFAYFSVYLNFSDNGRSEFLRQITNEKLIFQGKITRRISNNSYFIQVDTMEKFHKKFPTDINIYARFRKSVAPGDYIRFTGKIYPVSSLQNGFKNYLFVRNIRGFAKNSRLLKKIKHKSSWLEKIRYRTRQHLLNLPLQRFAKGLLLALLTGDKSKLTRNDKLLFSESGTSHLLAVSGLHVGILLSFVLLLLRVGYYFRLKKNLVYAFAILTIWSFAFFTGASASVLRAALMTSLFLFAKIIAKKTDILNILGTTMYILLIFHPVFAFDLGFQLSFSAVLGIVLFYPLLKKFLTANSSRFIIKYLYNATLVSLSAQLGVLPLSLYWFGTFPVYFLLANIFAIPLIFLIFYAGLFYAIAPLSVLGKIYEIAVQILAKYLEFITMLPGKTISLPEQQGWIFWLASGGLFLLGTGLTHFNVKYRKKYQVELGILGSV